VKPRVLIVDDDPEMLSAVESVLAGDYEVRSVSDPVIAESEASNFRPQLALLDLRMPKLDGFTLLQRLKERMPHLQVILMTGSVYDLDRDLVRAVREKAFYFIQKPFDREVLLTLVERCNEIRVLEEERRRHLRELTEELEEAARFQRSLLPPGDATCAGLSVAARLLPHDPVAGDLYDYAAADGAASFLVADVVGHGMSAALLTGMVKAAFGASHAEGYDPGAVVARVRAGFRGFPPALFATLLCARIMPAEEKLEVVNAGHPAGILATRSGTITSLGPTGPMVSALFGETSWSVARSSWGPGDRLVLVTDGLTEVRRGSEEFGEERLTSRVVAGRKLDGGALAEDVLSDIRGFAPKPDSEDDLTLIVVTDPR
jgi:serine phosphatase RsbU (regulator of sigma subunit)